MTKVQSAAAVAYLVAVVVAVLLVLGVIPPTPWSPVGQSHHVVHTAPEHHEAPKGVEAA